MTQPLTIEDLLQKLNPQQREAATHGDSPLLIVAGAGTGKTATLVHRVAWLIARGVDPGRILLLTFTRRAAAEMLRRVENLLRHLQAEGGQAGRRPAAISGWAISRRPPLGRNLSRRRHAIAPPLRQGHRAAARFHDPRSGRCRGPDERRPHRTGPGQDRSAVPQEGDLHGHLQPLRQRPREARTRPWSGTSPGAWNGATELKRLFSGYVDRKEACGVLDYDDLLLYWHGLLEDPTGRADRSRAVRLRAGR